MGEFTDADRDLLLALLALPTAGPLEAPDGPAPRLWEAGRLIATAAAEFGMVVHAHTAPDPAALDLPAVPLTVRDAAANDPGFLADQPTLLLRWGAPAPVDRTIMFNVHLDTVADLPTPYQRGDRVYGRGAIDAKGPAVALLAGLRATLRELDPDEADLCVLVQLVAGEEGGAMGVFGTRPLVEAGWVGRINVFCEPTGGLLLTRSTAAMTARIAVAGADAIDDAPGAGHNATVLLGYLAYRLAETATDWAAGARVCVAGLHTGHQHNRVFGSGTLLLNIAYGDTATGARVETALRARLTELVTEFRIAQRDSPLLARTAADAAELVTLTWLKRGLPALDAGERLAPELTGPGAPPTAPPDEAGFTCDAIWLAERTDLCTVVFGPGRLDTNNAHADGEYAELSELAAYATQIHTMTQRFIAATPSRTSRH